jgi:DNA-binding transcriptional ArsR family regulator
VPGPAAERHLAVLQAVVAALAHPARRQILLTMKLRGGRMTAGEIAGRFRHAWPTTTRHLRVLEDAGLVSCRKRGRTRVYRLRAARLAVVEEWLGWFSRS